MSSLPLGNTFLLFLVFGFLFFAFFLELPRPFTVYFHLVAFFILFQPADSSFLLILMKLKCTGVFPIYIVDAVIFKRGRQKLLAVS